jgi:hypothetical protein
MFIRTRTKDAQSLMSRPILLVWYYITIEESCLIRKTKEKVNEAKKLTPQ